jgi:hypothetical protein
MGDSNENLMGVGMKMHSAEGTRTRLVPFLVALVAMLCLLIEVPSAHAEFGVVGAGVFLGEANGEPARQAGSHPDLTFRAEFPSTITAGGAVTSDGTVRDLTLSLPAGMVGDATETATCTDEELVPGGAASASANCPLASQIGIVKVYSTLGAGDAPRITTNLYNLTHGSNVPALFGFNYAGAAVKIVPSVRPGDYGIDSGSTSISEAFTIFRIEVEIWGVPADASHDPERQNDTTGESGPSPGRHVPFLTLPTSCAGSALSFGVSADSWQNPGVFSSASRSSDSEGTPFVLTGCERLPFSPSISARATSREGEAPTGLSVDFQVPQSEAPEGLASSDVRRAVVRLPRGMAVSPSSASGLGACSESAIAIGTSAAPGCPDSSKIGTVQIKTPLLEETLTGSLYLAQQRANPFGSLLALYLAVKGPGFYLKLPGKVETDPVTGRLTVSFSDTPQLPFEDLQIALNSGPRAPLVTPRACGTYSVETEVTPWSGTAPVKGQSSFTIDQHCVAGGFSPGLNAGTANPTGGAFSPFVLQVTRNDGEEGLSKISATLPPGLLAKLAGVPLCADAQAVSGSCPAASEVGTTTIGVGPGSNPLYVPEPGKSPTAVYLAGPYKGAPYSLIVKVPAQAGPFDLGTVVVRNALRVDPTTTQVTAESDPLPQILEGIPITYRDVRVEINRPEFTINPTNCSQFAVASVLTSASGQTANPKAQFAATNCERLAFKPTLALQMKGQTKRAGNPALTATLKAPPGQANIAATTVILPKTVFIDQRHINGPCTRVQFNEGKCPASSVLGTAVAYSPLLDKPLEGPVYFRSNGGQRQLPDIVADLNGQIHVVLVGFIDSKKVGKETSLLRTRFASIPDAPVSKFVLRLKGGKRSLIQNSANLCKAQSKAEVEMTGQNGKTNDFEQKIAVSCGEKQPQQKNP